MKYLLTLSVFFIVLSFGLGLQTPKDFLKTCYTKGLGHRFSTDTCMGCICDANSQGRWLYKCTRCSNPKLSDEAKAKGCQVVESSAKAYPSCCPTVECPADSGYKYTLSNSWPTVRKEARTPPSRFPDRFVNFPRDCYIHGEGHVITSKRCERCVCTAKGGLRCRRCPTWKFDSLPSTCAKKEGIAGAQYPGCCDTVKCQGQE